MLLTCYCKNHLYCSEILTVLVVEWWERWTTEHISPGTSPSTIILKKKSQVRVTKRRAYCIASYTKVPHTEPHHFPSISRHFPSFPVNVPLTSPHSLSFFVIPCLTENDRIRCGGPTQCQSMLEERIGNSVYISIVFTPHGLSSFAIP